MANTFFPVILASTTACLVTTIGIYIIARYEQWGNKNVVYFMSFAAGVLISYPFISRIDRATLGLLLAASAGALVYVGASHLLPAVEKENQRYTIISLGAGILVAILIVLTKGQGE